MPPLDLALYIILVPVPVPVNKMKTTHGTCVYTGFRYHRCIYTHSTHRYIHVMWSIVRFQSGNIAHNGDSNSNNLRM